MLKEALPFYNIGHIRSSFHADPSNVWDEVEAIYFHLTGEEQGFALFTYPRTLDASLYSEMGNVLVSYWANERASKHSKSVLISSPRVLGNKQLERLRLSIPSEHYFLEHDDQASKYPISLQIYLRPERDLLDA